MIRNPWQNPDAVLGGGEKGGVVHSPSPPVAPLTQLPLTFAPPLHLEYGIRKNVNCSFPQCCYEPSNQEYGASGAGLTTSGTLGSGSPRSFRVARLGLDKMAPRSAIQMNDILRYSVLFHRLLSYSEIPHVIP